ncbi:beta barrel domain-containing protein [Streptomyces sp. URMC 129]|uniref:beta barrel domain-containing protein n=1 Tax=Streptomyces sp. URMC 129 TaxID=3423407 RepID=UPI003F1DD793
MGPKFTRDNVKAGDELLLIDRNSRGEPRKVAVAGVGRKLIRIEMYGQTRSFRMSDGIVNNKYGHSCLEWPAVHAENKRRSVLLDRLRQFGLEFRFGFGTPSVSRLEALVKVMEAEDPPGGGVMEGAKWKIACALRVSQFTADQADALADELYGSVAHELAEKIRADIIPELDEYGTREQQAEIDGRRSAADLIDPEVTE